jgi:DNA replication protein DnaC
LKNDTSPIMVKGAFGIGKTATLHYMFHYAWTKLGVPAFMLNLEDIIAEIKKYLIENNDLKSYQIKM